MHRGLLEKKCVTRRVYGGDCRNERKVVPVVMKLVLWFASKNLGQEVYRSLLSYKLYTTGLYTTKYLKIMQREEV